MKRMTLALCVLAAVLGVYFVGCRFEDPTSSQAPPAVSLGAPSRALLGDAQFNAVLVPSSDVSNTGWVPYPEDPWSLWDKIDEGVGNSYSDIIYTEFTDKSARFGFTNVTGYSAIDVSALTFVIHLDPAQAEALEIYFDFYYYIDGNEEGYARYQCGDMSGNSCLGDTTWVVAFDDVCYDLADINSLEARIVSGGVWWDAGNSSIEVHAMDAHADFDAVCTPEISELASSRNVNTVSVTWATECTATSRVIWGYSSGSLTNTATGSNGTDHTVSFAVGSTEGCVYYKAISAGLTCSAPADTSSQQTDVKDVVISNVVRSFNPSACTITVTWTTNVKSSSKIYWGYSCASLTNTATGAGNTTSHSVTIDATGISRTKVAIVAESDSGCDVAQSACATVYRNYCIAQ